MENVLCFLQLMLLILHKTAHCYENIQGWNYINLHCRDNNNKPVDWWYIYKPPSKALPYRDSINAFSYITPKTAGRWIISDKNLIANSLLQHTLSPAFRPTYVDYLATMKYDQRNGSSKGDRGTAMHGILMADEVGGIWITHTVPGFPDLSWRRLTFPKEESTHGHMFMCMSLDLVTLNQVAAVLKVAAPRFTKVNVPRVLKLYMPDWDLKLRHGFNSTSLDTRLNFQTNEKLQIIMMVRKPGKTHCLYRKFARQERIVLDVYGHRDHKRAVCKNSYSVRHIDSISLKDPGQVLYLSNNTDHSGFAVSTGAHWQRAGGGAKRYWTCVHSPDDGLLQAGLVLCVENYAIWLSFDNLKVNEPKF